MKATQNSIREKNLGLMLRNIIKNDNVSRISISKNTKLAKSTVSNLANLLIKNGVIYEAEKINSETGKKPTKLNFNYNLKYILAIDIGQDDLLGVIANLKGDIIYRIDNRNYYKKNRSEILSSIYSIIDRLLVNSKKSQKDIILFSIGTHGIVNPETNIVTNAPYLKGWSGVNIADILNKKYKKQVILNNAVNLGALAEQWKNYENISNLIYIDIDHGIGAGIIISNKMLVGRSGTMGEISYLPITLENDDYTKLKKNNMDLGIFEKQVDISGIEKKIKENLINNKINLDINQLNYERICQLYEINKEIKDIIDKKIIRTLAVGIASIISMIDTDIVILNGKILKLGDTFFTKLKREILSLTPFKPKIVKSKLKEDAHIIGALKKGLDFVYTILYNEFFTFFEQ
jgi:predicted NBD/HSP70 family sugar kinase